MQNESWLILCKWLGSIRTLWARIMIYQKQRIFQQHHRYKTSCPSNEYLPKKNERDPFLMAANSFCSLRRVTWLAAQFQPLYFAMCDSGITTRGVSNKSDFSNGFTTYCQNASPLCFSGKRVSVFSLFTYDLFNVHFAKSLCLVWHQSTTLLDFKWTSV